MRCDRGTNFIGAEVELKKAIEEMDDQKIKAELLKESIDWIKNPASASNFDGVWERQIRSIRNVMNGLIRGHGNRLDEDTSDSGDSKRSPLRTTIIAKYAAYWNDKTCAAPAWRV